MPKEEKKQKVEEIYQKLLQANSVIFTDFKGLTVADLSQLRTKLREVGAEYRVVKNTLALRAFQKYLPNKNVEEYLRGAYCIYLLLWGSLWSSKDSCRFFKGSREFEIKGWYC